MLSEFILLALSLPASTYGHSELACGDVHAPRECSSGAITASGEAFHPDEVPSAAVPAPLNLRMRKAHVVYLQNALSGKCVGIRVNDKAHPRWVGSRGLDLSPAALRALGIEPTKWWSGRLTMCETQTEEEEV